MLRPRIIPCLLVHNGGLVKTVAFKEPKYVGDPINAVKIFNEKQADELAVFDIDATARGAEPDFKMVANLAAECRMPLCYGGGVKTVAQAKRIIGLGVEKIAISSAAIETPELVSAAAQEIGGQSVVVVIDAKKDSRTGSDLAWTHNGTRNSGRSVIEMALEAESRGAGEIVVNSIDNDGRMKGYDLALARSVRQAVKLPVTLLGGAGSLAHIGELVASCGVVGAAAGSLFVFKGPYRAVLINYPEPAKRDELFQLALR
ncbi:imidazole glycerol phosphate synthase subunit HisF [Bradyrhizobium sp. KBS0727]|uniref:AglZ/HisF2 family acetamidino modification protein n=1 Tax=unclassified Bradyrhizobium TaxID=2631580 RepID=UPI00110E1CBC|nr:MULTISPECIES: AglZ/HisF2 family acetamidino modification protein [unclassified Bradyrhizobium]QDW39788.1 imidazole glycerol phosphate synthase subunit HisF [Bradyrhizobium sp. KBS0725]QDW46391.1 imidazole glycerol phosphate synthase subunit HisF [Bradyrhizobium sp. KBS0727]